MSKGQNNNTHIGYPLTNQPDDQPEKGSESNKERHLGKQMDKKNVGQLQENSGSAIKKLREEQRYIIQKESTAISFSGKRHGFKEKHRNWLKYKYTYIYVTP